eukprot:jgi/Orpsp1_1/1179171/evm.model.c7180000068293.1
MSLEEKEIKEFFHKFFETEMDDENKKYDKVIFLDVDGVLTDDTNFTLQIDEERMARLKRIIDATDAKVVLSSSRRRAYLPYLYNSDSLSEKIKKEMDHFQKMLDKYNITISDYTGDVGIKGYRSRPYEIRSWLLNKHNLKRFVILDDENWSWNWMDKYVVKTARKNPNDKYSNVYGLEDEDVELAIEILNEDKQKED